jgi:hypothetical protein
MDSKLKTEKVHYGRGFPRPNSDKELAIRLLNEGNSFRATGRLIGVSHQTIGQWLKDYTNKIPFLDSKINSGAVEIDELCTFVKKK